MSFYAKPGQPKHDPLTTGRELDYNADPALVQAWLKLAIITRYEQI
ncbi:uncharacterized protein G2W53_006229 [Senna tora]|uniref:Uncharacterized protein n=1 Tax=Senna tora TaxID=362788 RepID=A0A834X4Y4_9FABA|nr:uncharacterized protein G2W53_006229 [Senna tora]